MLSRVGIDFVIAPCQPWISFASEIARMRPEFTLSHQDENQIWPAINSGPSAELRPN